MSHGTFTLGFVSLEENKSEMSDSHSLLRLCKGVNFICVIIAQAQMEKIALPENKTQLINNYLFLLSEGREGKVNSRARTMEQNYYPTS